MKNVSKQKELFNKVMKSCYFDFYGSDLSIYCKVVNEMNLSKREQSYRLQLDTYINGKSFRRMLARKCFAMRIRQVKTINIIISEYSGTKLIELFRKK